MVHKVEQKALRQIIKKVAEKGATYPSEIAAFTDYDEKTVGQICRRLTEANYFERLEPKFKGGDPRLRKRSDAVNGGIQAMKGRDWYALNSAKEWRLRLWDDDRVVNEYGELIDFILEDEKPSDRVTNDFVNQAVNNLDARGLI